MTIGKTSFVIGFLAIGFLYGCQKKSPADLGVTSWIHFEWEGDTLGTRYYDKAAILIPFRLAGIPGSFVMQFDLGAPVSMLYGNTAGPLLTQHPALLQKLDTANKTSIIEGRPVGALQDVSFYLDTVLFTHRQLAWFAGFGDSLSAADTASASNQSTIIGTIGADLLADKILVIDFPGQQLAVVDSLAVPDTSRLVDIEITHGRILVPVRVNGTEHKVLFDTGSSLMSLFLSTRNWDAYRNVSQPLDTLRVQAWGRYYNLYMAPAKAQVTIGRTVLQPDSIMANELPQYYEFYKNLGILGIMGNRMFYDKIVIIDFKRQKFGVFDKDNSRFTARGE